MVISVLVADQERTFADVLAARLDEEDDIEVVVPSRCKHQARRY